jgi:hypothetical protein
MIEMVVIPLYMIWFTRPNGQRRTTTVHKGNMVDVINQLKAIGCTIRRVSR